MKYKSLLVFSLIFALLVSCSKSPEVAEQEIPEEEPPDAPGFVSIWLPPYLPEDLVRNFRPSDGLVRYTDQSSADLTLDVSDEAIVSEWVYALAAPFPTVTDGIASRDLVQFWNGNQQSNLPFDELLVDGGTKAIFERIWGPASLTNVRVISKNELLSTAWDKRTSWAIIPFEMIEPQWKVIALDGQSPLNKAFNPPLYPLKVPFSVIGNPNSVAEFQSQFGHDSAAPVFPVTNRDVDKLTTVMVTGVTALVRGTAYLMERNGMTYPAIDIGDLLRSADILHISNEISFSPTCPNPFAKPENDANLVFCSKPEYIQLLEAIGTDVVELTGDHFIDQSDESMLFTIDMYEQRGWQYYGGGRNYDDGIAPALFEHNGNRIAFLGCNAKPLGYSTASETRPGAVHCDMPLMAEKVREVIAKDYQPIFTFQHLEYYSYGINSNVVDEFHQAADAGAVIVSGSQAHMPHGFEFYKSSLIHYGLGNLFFDQFKESMEQRKAFVDVHVFYGNQYIGTQLVTIQFIDLARTRFMTIEERTELLEKIFFASGW
jgi:poly-gamma-glutamate synthesis protein (capsule biosynthesis protein)